MKKYSILFLGALGLLAASCDDNHIEPAKPQQNPQEEILKNGNITSETDGVLASGSLTLAQYPNYGDMIPVMKLVSAENLPAGSEVIYHVEISNTSAYDVNAVLTATDGGDGVYYVESSEWNNAHVAIFGESQRVRNVYYRVSTFVELDGSDYRYDASNYTAQGLLKETCIDTGVVTELFTPGAANGNSVADSQPLAGWDETNFQGYAHLNGTFKLVNSLTSGKTYGMGAEEGVLQENGSDIPVPGDNGLYWVEVNLGDMTYKLTQISTIGMVGAFNDWNVAEAEALTPSTDFLTWTVTVNNMAAGDWKFCANNGWDISLGTSLGNLTQGGNNLHLAQTGTYEVVLHLNDVPYTATMTKK
ncbi:MAG: hypothetical protein K2J92_08635 [Muribaculaceae bacterium]|nr:hypothetical protein [Muribaculaceae bacterium]MDE7190826.1 hypothetical protein [Muribaculaceae bacterium]